MNMCRVLILAMLVLLPVQAFGANSNTPAKGNTMGTKLRMTFDNQEVIVEMFDNPASRDFMALLPLTMDFGDFAMTEKIATLPRKLHTQGSPTPREATGDFTYYAPWGNLAIFYHGFGTDGQLYVLGRIASGKDKLATMPKPFTALLRAIE